MTGFLDLLVMTYEIIFKTIYIIIKPIYYLVKFVIIWLIRLTRLFVICLIRTIKEMRREYRVTKNSKGRTSKLVDDWEVVNKNGRVYLKYGDEN